MHNQRLIVRTLLTMALGAALAAVFLARFAQLNASMPGVRATPVAQGAQEAPDRDGAEAQPDAPAGESLGPDPLRRVTASGGVVEVRDAGGVVASFASLEPEDGFGEAAAQLAGDLLAVGAPRSGLDAPLAGRVYILPTTPRGQARGPGAAGQRAAEPMFAQRAAPITLTIGEAGARFGSGVAALEDPFGAPLVLVTAPGAGEGPERGRAYLFDPLAEPGEGGELEPFAELSGLPGDAFGVAAERAEDLNGDGRADATVLSLFADDSFNTRLRRQTFTGAGELVDRQSDEESPILRLAGDLNADGVVDAADLGLLLSTFGRARPAGGTALDGDLNHDGVVDGSDLSLLLGSFGETASVQERALLDPDCTMECTDSAGRVFLCDACAEDTCCQSLGDPDEGGGDGPGSRDGSGSTGGNDDDGGGGGGNNSTPDDDDEKPVPPSPPDGSDGGNDECQLLLDGPLFGPTSILAKGRPYTFSTPCEDPSWNVSGGDALPRTEDFSSVDITFIDTGWQTISPGCGCTASYLVADIPMELDATFVEAPAPPDGGDPPPEFAVLLTNNDDDDNDGEVDMLDGDGVGVEAGVVVEDDLVTLTLSAIKGATSGHFVMDKWRLSASDRVRVWYAAPEDDGGPEDLHAHAPDETGEIIEKVFNGVTYRLMPTAWIEVAPVTQTYLVEGMHASTAVADARLEYTFQGEASWRPTPEDERIRYPVTLTNEVFATVFAVDLDIDSDNDGVIDDADEGEELLPPGKIFFVNDDDDDDNGVPDKDQSGAVDGENDLVPIYIEPGPAFSQNPPNSWWKLTYPATVRVWDGTDRSGLIDSGAVQAWPPQDTLYVEGLAPSAAAGDINIHLTQSVYGAGPFTDEVVATVTELSVHDLRHWGPMWSLSGGPSIENMDLDADIPGSEVGGAITDGASVCLVRLKPDLGAGTHLAISVVRKGEEFLDRPDIVGAVKFADNGVPPPELPMPEGGVGFTSKTDFDSQKAYFVPPDGYLDQHFNPTAPVTLTSQETSQIEFQVLIGTASGTERILCGRSFLLRRPPLVLVHGLWGSPDTWNPASTPWHDTPGPGFPTRIYRVDYEETNDAGFDVNWTEVVTTIEGALNEYRTASEGTGHHPDRAFDGVRFAATRADVVGHSMGGVLTRLYVSGVIGVVNRETSDTTTFAVSRSGTLEDGRVTYRRDDNWGAGSIRRFVSIGSPYDGSSLAVAARDAFLAEHKANGIKPIFDNPLPAIRNLIDPPDPGVGGIDVGDFGVVPNAIYDLIPDSDAQRMIECRHPEHAQDNVYPTGAARVRWHPIVGIASADVPVPKWKKFMWGGALDTLSPLFFNGLEDLNGANGDLVVNKDSQANGQIDQATVFPSHIHTAIPGMDNFNVQTEVRSTFIAARVKQLLSTNNSDDWQGDLKP